MNPYDFHKIIKKIKDRNEFFIHEMDIRREIDNLFKNEKFIQEADVSIPFIMLKTKLPTDFLTGYYKLPKKMIDKDFACLDYNTYLIDCDKFDKEEDKCDIVDIANKEMEKIDSSEIDSEFDKIIIKELTQSLINSISEENCSRKKLDDYLEKLNTDDILDLRISGTFLYVKTTNNMNSLLLSNTMEVPIEYIEKVPINGNNKFYHIDCRRWNNLIQREDDSIYDPEPLVDHLLDIGGNCVGEDLLITTEIFDAVTLGLKQNWEEMPEDIEITVEIEDKVVAIALNQFILDAKDVISEALFLNPELFIEVSTPLGTVLLIDTRRWYLEPDFGGQEWFL